MSCLAYGVGLAVLRLPASGVAVAVGMNGDGVAVGARDVNVGVDVRGGGRLRGVLVVVGRGVGLLVGVACVVGVAVGDRPSTFGVAVALLVSANRVGDGENGCGAFRVAVCGDAINVVGCRAAPSGLCVPANSRLPTTSTSNTPTMTLRSDPPA